MFFSTLLLGDLRNEEQVFEWLIEDENRELADEIEDVNGRMLDKLINDKPFLAVLFYSKEDCSECDEAIAALENIDDEADIFGIDFVKGLLLRSQEIDIT